MTIFGSTITNFTTTPGQELNIGGVGYNVQDAGKSYSLEEVDNQTVRFEIQGGDHAWFDGSGVDRSELSGSLSVPAGTPVNINYNFMMEPGPTNAASWMTVGEVHNNDGSLGNGWSSSPPIAIQMQGDNLKVVARYCPVGLNPNDSAGNDTVMTLWTSPTPIVRGQYYDIDIAYDASDDSSGYLKVSINGQQVVNYSGPLGYGTPTYWESGLYRHTIAQDQAADFRNLVISTGSDAAPSHTVAGTSDFNGDGKSDLLFLNNTTHGVAVWELNGAQVIANPQVGVLASGFHFAHEGDFNGDGKTDLLMLNDTTHEVAVWLMNGAQVASSTTVGTINAAGGWQFADVGDFNGDGKSDLLFVNSATHGVAVWQMDGAQVTANPQAGIMASGFHFAATGDFNGDGKTDLLMINDTTHDVSISQMNGTQVTSTTTVGTINATGGWHFAGVGDFNGDGKSDLLFLNDTTHGAAVWLMNGNQVTANPQIGTINAAGGWHFADIGDFNGDGKSDLLFLNDTTHGVAVWQMNGTQVTANPQVGIAAAGDSYVGLQDINGDHKSDLLFENATTHVLTAWEMNGTQVALDQQISTINAAAGWHLAT